MNNHNHVVGEVVGVEDLSCMMRSTHSKYARWYNDRNDRRGAVGMDRPKSIVVQNNRHYINAVLYLDSNPVRAGIVKHPKDYPWSSHNYYAYGQRRQWDKMLESPSWYKELGATPRLRQRAYRKLCDAYLRREGLLPQPGLTLGRYVGEHEWVQRRQQRQRAALLKRTSAGQACRVDLPSLDTS
jgi:putative transposase